MSSIRYNPGFYGDDELIRKFVVRNNELRMIVDTLSERTGSANGHILVVGPRGIGKTTLLRRVAAEVRKDPDLSKCWYPLVFGEEAYDVVSPGEFWLEALFHLADQTKESRYFRAYEDLKKSERDDTRLRDRALSQLMDFADEQGKRILLIVENLNMLLGQQLDDDDAWDLRHTLQNEPRIMLLGSATTRFEEIKNVRKAWFETTTILPLKPLKDEESKVLWKSLTGVEPMDSRLRPLQILTGGNPRLLNIIAGFAKKTSFRELMNSLIQLIDDHTEYFKGQLDGLAATERKVFVTLLELWAPASAQDVAQAARMEVSKVSSFLGRLINRGAVVTVASGRKKYYQAAERLYNIYYLMRRRSHPSHRVHAIVVFMVEFYERDQLITHTAKIAEEACKLDPEHRHEHYLAYEDIISHLPEPQKIKVVRATPNEFFQRPDTPAQVRKLIELLNALQKEPPALSKKDRPTPRKHIRKPQSVKSWLQRGNALSEDTSNFKDAERAYKKALELDGDNDNAWFLLGKLYEKSKRFEEAEQAFRKATELNLNNASAWMSLGINVYYLKGDYREAAQAMRKVTELQPNRSIAWALLGKSLLHEVKSHEEAELSLRQAVQLDQNAFDAWLDLATLLHNSGRYSEAEEPCLKAIELKPDNALALARFGHLHARHLDRVEEAEQYLRKALEINSNYAEAWEDLGYLLARRLNRLDEGEQALRKAVELFPNNYSAWGILGQTLYQTTKRYNEAEQALRKSIELFPDYAWAWAELGYLQYTYLKQFEEAEKSLRKAIKLDPEEDFAWKELGHLFHIHLKQYDEAEKVYREALQHNPNYSWAWSHLSDVLSKDKRYEEAIQANLKAIDLDPNSYNCLMRIELYLKTNKFKAAFKMAQQFSKGVGSDEANLNSLAWLFYELGPKQFLSEAEGWIRRALAASPDSWRAKFTLASILGAQAKWDEALELSPEFLDAPARDRSAIRGVTDFIISAAASGHARRALEILNGSKGITALEPLAAGLKIFLGEIPYAAQEVLEVGQDVATKIKRLQEKQQAHILQEKAAH